VKEGFAEGNEVGAFDGLAEGFEVLVGELVGCFDGVLVGA